MMFPHQPLIVDSGYQSSQTHAYLVKKKFIVDILDDLQLNFQPLIQNWSTTVLLRTESMREY